MDDRLELISDGDGLAVLGNPSAVERFMASVGLSRRWIIPRRSCLQFRGISCAGRFRDSGKLGALGEAD